MYFFVHYDTEYALLSTLLTLLPITFALINHNPFVYHHVFFLFFFFVVVVFFFFFFFFFCIVLLVDKLYYHKFVVIF